MKFLGVDKDGNYKFAWCCDRARDAKGVIGFLNDGKRMYDSDRTGFHIFRLCSGPDSPGYGKHELTPINFCPFCSAKVENN